MRRRDGPTTGRKPPGLSSAGACWHEAGALTHGACLRVADQCPRVERSIGVPHSEHPPAAAGCGMIGRGSSRGPAHASAAEGWRATTVEPWITTSTRFWKSATSARPQRRSTYTRFCPTYEDALEVYREKVGKPKAIREETTAAATVWWLDEDPTGAATITRYTLHGPLEEA